MVESNLDQCLNFLREIDKLKSVVRASPLIDRSRKENSAEHSWHLAMYALILSDHSDHKINLERVLKMLLLHDIVEIDAGDTPLHGQADHSVQEQKEREAAERLFGILPSNQCEELRNLWQEFEEAVSSDARFAKSLDRLQPLIHNVAAKGGTWTENDVQHEQVLERYGPSIETGSTQLWEKAKELVSEYFENEK